MGAGTSAAPMQQPLNSRVRLADLQGSLRDEEAASPLATTSRVPSRTRLLAERALSPFFAPESTDSSTDPRAQPRRLVRRDSPFHQSSGKINMHRGLRAGQLLGLAQKDWYHVRALLEPLDGLDSWRPDAMPCFWQVLLSMKSRSLLFVIVCTFTLVVVFYAFMFMLADYSLEGCGIAPKGQHATFYNVCPFTSAHTLTPVVACTLETPPSPPQPGLRVLTRDADNDWVCGAVRQG